MLRRLLAGLAVLAATAAAGSWGLARFAPESLAAALWPIAEDFRVEYVYDGDTVKLADGRRVRLLNLNAPEVETKVKRGEPGGEQAKEALKALVQNRQVRLEFDVERQDKYGRTLAYLFTADGIHVNVELVRQGLAWANLHPPNLKYAEAILAAQREAESVKRGIWGMAAYAPQPIEVLRHKKLYGWHRFVGQAKRIKTLRKFVRLEFEQGVYVTIPKANLKWFKALETYLGQNLEVRGWPAWRGRTVSILVRHPSALVVLG
jgi:endonuclease YncB( thermonuclease family)